MSSAAQACAAAELAGLRALYAALDPALGPVVEDVGGAAVLAVRAWPDHPWANGVVWSGEGPVGAALERLVALGATRPWVGAPAGAEPGGGLTAPLRLLRLAAPAGGSVPEGVRRAGPADVDDVVGVCRAGFGGWHEDADRAWWGGETTAAGWSRWLLREQGRPVASGAVHVAGPTAYLGGTATVPQARGRGAQAALLAARRAHAASHGAERVAARVEAGGGSHRNLLRAGFVEVGETVQWRRPA